ncbi:MAG: nitroreductase family protein [Lachnospiraceae bacterium]|nr:nitroreductase family protein [Lachnospiraceae bacterium]
MKFDIVNFLKTKRTYRKFKQIPVPGDALQAIMLAGQLYSCGANKQSIKYVIVNKPEDVYVVNGLVKWAAYLPKEVGTPAKGETPVMYIAVIQDTDIEPVNDTSAGLAIGNMQSTAWYFGIGSCIMGAIDRPKLKSFLKIPQKMKLHSMIAFGYPMIESEPVECDGDVKYYINEKGGYSVPKRPIDEIYRFL